MKMKALFLDRDGTLIEHVDYLRDPKKVRLLPGVAEALRYAKALGYHLFLHSNQSGLGLGKVTMIELMGVHRQMLTELRMPEAFDAVCFPPEPPGAESAYRKPSPRFIQECVAKYSLDPALCWMVGDRRDDVLAGVNANIRSALVLTGLTKHPDWVLDYPSWQVKVYQNLTDFTDDLR
jgi:D-glycero-D-manno-heptose 1,7-bisphosphate phosphatase